MPRVIEGPADWRGPDLAHSRAWIHEMSTAEAAEIGAALDIARRRGRTFESLTTDDFPLPAFAGVLDTAREALENGLGLYHIRGLPVAGRPKDDLRMIYWGIGKHLGTAVSQSKDGDLLGDVRDFGVDINSPQGRGYKSRQQLSYHTDTADVVGLMVLRTARQGGLSKLISSLAVHNEIVRTRPDLAAMLYQPFPWSWQGQEPLGQPPFYLQPICTEHNGKLACRYIRVQILSSQRFPAAPRLNEAQHEAMALFDRLAASDAFCLTMAFEPGDIQLLCNHTCLHSRTAFEDDEEEDRKRHLLRMWLSVPNSRELSPHLATIYRDRRAGAVRGGFPSRTGQHQYHTVHSIDS